MSWKAPRGGGHLGRTPNCCCWWWSDAPSCSESQQSPRGSPELWLQKQVSLVKPGREHLENSEGLQAENQMFRTERRPVLLHGAAKENTHLFSLFPHAKHKQCGFSGARPPQPLMEGLLLPPVTLKTRRTQNSTQVFSPPTPRAGQPFGFAFTPQIRPPWPCTGVSEGNAFLVWWVTKGRLRVER